MNLPAIVRSLLVLLLVSASGFGQDASQPKATIKLNSGEVLTGVVGSVRDGSLSLITEYGPVRIPLERISQESKDKLGLSSQNSTETMAARIRELEQLVAKLREENAALRRSSTNIQPAAGGLTPRPASPGVRTAPAPATQASGSHRLSKTGKRHNANCRYYGSDGRSCGPSEGVACKICGG